MKKIIFGLCFILQAQFGSAQITSSSIFECECNIQKEIKILLEKFYSDHDLVMQNSEAIVLEYDKEGNVNIKKYRNIGSAHIECLNSYFKSVNFDCYLKKYKKGEFEKFYMPYSKAKFEERCDISD